MRGLNRKGRKQDLKNHIAQLKPSLIGLVETKVRPNKVYIIKRCIPRNWDFATNYDYSLLGIIWICWNPNVWHCQVCNSSKQKITCIASNTWGYRFYSQLLLL